MRIFVNTFGTQGDVQPYVALGARLVRAGHAVTICTCERFRPLIEEHGLAYGYMSNDLLELMDTDAGRGAIDGGRLSWVEYARQIRTLIARAADCQRDALRLSWEACEAARPDLIVYHPKALGAPHFAQHLGVPAVLALLQPICVPTSEFPVFVAPRLPFAAGSYNRWTYAAAQWATRSYTATYSRAWRESAGMPPDEPPPADALILHGYSPLVLPRPADWPSQAVVTGFWTLPTAACYLPSAALARFLADGPSPVYVGFGSMSGADPSALAQLVIEALTAAGARGVLATGGGGLRAEVQLPDSIHLLDKAPHEWLFPRMAAIVHHGGAGTTAAGLRAGKPMVVCPFFGDQPLWASRAHALGVASEAIPQKRLTKARLASAIALVTTDAGMRERAAALGEKLRAEDGAGNAAARLEAVWLAAGSRRAKAAEGASKAA
jgi:sterol 3beta-glucosyltransferase